MKATKEMIKRMNWFNEKYKYQYIQIVHNEVKAWSREGTQESFELVWRGERADSQHLTVFIQAMVLGLHIINELNLKLREVEE